MSSRFAAGAEHTYDVRRTQDRGVLPLQPSPAAAPSASAFTGTSAAGRPGRRDGGRVAHIPAMRLLGRAW